VIRRAALWVIAAAAMLLALAAATALVALHSETVLRWSVADISARYPGRLSVGAVSGTLSGPITLDQVQIHAPSFDAQIRSLTLDWRITALLARHLDITSWICGA